MGGENRREIVPRALSLPPVQTQRLSFLMIIIIIIIIIIIMTISTHPGDYSQRDIDTRTKEKPSTKDLEEINQAIKLLMERYEVTPTQNPFGFLWLANCVLYSVVCAFLLMKGWKN